MKMAESEEEVDVLVQRVVKDINNAFKRNPNIDEIGLIPCPEARYNRSPIVLVENKLGVESWCVKFLLPYVHNKLLLYRQRKQWLDREALVDITCTLLLLNPDFTTAWNVRKELLQCGMLNPEKDLYLGKLALSKHPKSPETWIHRRWVLQWLQKECSPSGQEPKDQAELRGDAVRRRRCERLQRALQEEMRVCADAAGRYPSNYNAWSHRIWVLQNLAKGSLKVLHDELSSTRLWVSMHVSDHSGFHYRQHLLKALARELSQVGETELHPTQQPNGESTADASDGSHHNDVIPQLFHEEMELCTDLIESYPGHETLWCHRRHVFYLWHQWRREHLQGAGSQSPPLTHTDVLLSEEPCDEASASQAMDVDCVLDGRKHGSYTQDTKRLKRGPLLPHPLLPSEHTFVSRILTGCRSPEQSRFAIAYRKWLDSVIGQ
ncbi:protein prenyltransferase alpha subunit repeat-containing protein 1 [Carassius gibelio]|uniref:protein prenyltransferase alpha subunit repeat-containing protein 1 n=1 Tax=Carassius gibelio TaxID=101364 RepID=UPI002279E49B|nr:protein prenyltransferase alpha subunit repeat-containing protein 1 [Carassius gibelio]